VVVKVLHTRASEHSKAMQGKAKRGKARQGKARQGKARQGKARQGKAHLLEHGVRPVRPEGRHQQALRRVLRRATCGVRVCENRRGSTLLSGGAGRHGRAPGSANC